MTRPAAPATRRDATSVDRWVGRALAACAAVVVAVAVGLAAALLYRAGTFVTDVSIGGFFTDAQWQPDAMPPRAGIAPLLLGTALTTALAVMVALPCGLLSAIYLSEFAGRRARALLEPALALLGSVPTIVYGYFALVFATPFLQRVIPGLAGQNALAPGLLLGVVIAPTIAAGSRLALAAVPASQREAAYALGARKLTCALRVVVPAARAGIASAVALAVARAAGETMIVTVAAGRQPRLSLDPRVPVETMTAYIAQVGQTEPATDAAAYRAMFAVGAVLLLLTYAWNFASQRLAPRRRQGEGGA